MTKMPLIILIPALAVFLVIASVFAWQMGKTSVPVPEQSVMVPQSTMYDEASESTGTSMEADSASPVADLEQELSTTVDDGGASDFTDLEQASSGL